MAKYRYIQVTYWNDPFIISLPLDKKAFYLYLITNSRTTQCGIYEIALQTICHDTGLSIETVREFIVFFESSGKIVYSQETGEILMCNWAKYNYTDSIPVKKCVANEFIKVKNKDLISYLYGTGTVPIGYTNPMVTPLQQKEKEEEKEEQELKEEEKEKKRELVDFLSEEDINSTIEFMHTTERIQYSYDEIDNYWKAFKIHSEGIEYPDHSQTMRHFRNWLKRQPKKQKTMENEAGSLMKKHMSVNSLLKEKYAREEREKMMGKPGYPLSPI